MPAPKLDLSQWQSTVLLHNNFPHNVVNLLEHAYAEATPNVGVPVDEIGPMPGNDDLPANLFLMQPSDAGLADLPLVIYKYQGRYHVLVGQAKVDQARRDKASHVKGKLVSTQSLKKTRIIKTETPAPLNPALPSYPASRTTSYRTPNRRNY